MLPRVSVLAHSGELTGARSWALRPGQSLVSAAAAWKCRPLIGQHAAATRGQQPMAARHWHASGGSL